MKAVTPIPFVRAKFTDKCGKPLVGGKIYTYESNTTTPKNTYKDPYGMTSNTNPIILDTAGEADIYLHGTYRIIVKDRRNAVINDVSKLGSWFSATLDDALNDISMAFNDTIQPIIDDAEKSFIAIEQNLNNEKNEILQSLQDAIDQALAAGAGVNGWTDSLISTGILDAITQRDVNRKTVTTVPELSALSSLMKWQNRNVYVMGDGHYYFDGTNWEKNQTLNIYDFKTQQYVAYYYKKFGNWDDAIFEAQCNIFTKGLSPKLILPNGLIYIKKPIFGGQGLYEKLQKERPEIASSIVDTMKIPPCNIEGVPRMTEGYISEKLGTQIVFMGHKNADDMQWANFGIIHCGSQDPVKIRSNEFSSGTRCIIKNLNVMAGDTGNGDLSIHGIVISRGSQHIVDDVTVYACYGSGLYLDWVFDSSFHRVGIMKCGRMSPKYRQYLNENKTDIQYQTYAPLHIHRSADDKADNSNFLYFDKIHFEDNNDCNADIIVSGNSIPVVMRNLHHESDGWGVGSKNNKSCFALGEFGVKYFGQDQESSFDYTNFPKPDYTGYVTMHDTRLYTPAYSATGYGSAWSIAKLINCDYALPYVLNTYNTGGGLYLSGTNVGDFVHTGFTDRGYLLDAVNSSIGDIYLGKGDGSGGNVRLNNADCGAMSIGSNAVGSWADDITIQTTNAKFTKITGNYPNFIGDLSLTSKTEASDIKVRLNADIDIHRYAYYESKVSS